MGNDALRVRHPRAALVVTTVHDSPVLDSYFDNFKSFGHLDQVEVIVVPDRKTPSQVYARCQALRQRGLNIACPTLEEQESFLRRVGFPPHLIPYDSDNRRNVGYLMALESAADFMITIDDDNYCRHDVDFFQEHAIVYVRGSSLEVVDSQSGWFNVCSLLGLDRSGNTYPRGFPYYARHKHQGEVVNLKQVDVDINAGLWLQDPDVDGISWLVAPAHATSFSGRSVVLGLTTWSPVNTQNTALRREAVAAYYFVRMGYPLAGQSIDRYGDIFSGYFVQACARHLGTSVRVGTPVVEHLRNAHNYMADASREWACILVIEDLLPWLAEAKLEGGSYAESYVSLSYALQEAVEQFRGLVWNDATRGYFHQMAFHMRKWAAVSGRLLG
jgi:hypothetical protein